MGSNGAHADRGPEEVRGGGVQMGNFEKLGVLVIIVLVVVIVVVAAWGGEGEGRVPVDEDIVQSDRIVEPDDDLTRDLVPDPVPDPLPVPVPDPDPIPVPVPVPPSAVAKTHTIQSNDSLWSISVQYYGRGSNWHVIERANPGPDPELLPLGRKIIIPKLESAPVRPDVKPPAGTRSYTVKKGDSFWRIARQQLGRGGRHTEIATLNPNVDSSRMREDTTILIPVR